MNTVSKTFAVGTLMAMAQVAAAQSPLSVNVGLINVNPDSDRSLIDSTSLGIGVDDNTTLGITFDYFLSPNIAVEVVAALPFEHDIDVDSGVGPVGSTKHLPPTVLAQYHVGAEDAVFRPFVGLGLNYTIFFSEEVVADNGATATEIELDSSVGLAAQVGFNFEIDDAWGIHAMAMLVDIDTDATVTTSTLGTLTSTVEIDPWVVMIGAKFNL
jgi:outer membrane protein